MPRLLRSDAEADTIARARRAAIYNSEASKRQRAEAAAARRGDTDPIADLRRRHRDEVQAVAERHRDEGLELDRKHQRERAADRHIANGGGSYPELLAREAHQRGLLLKRHEAERSKLRDRHRTELSRALLQHRTRDLE